MKTLVRCLAIYLVFQSIYVLASPKSVERQITLTYGGFISGGDENQKVEGICTPSADRTALQCDIYNGLPEWKLTVVALRIARSAPDIDTHEYHMRVSIPPMTTQTVTIKLGLRLPDDEGLYSHPTTHWGWLLVGAAGIPLGNPETMNAPKGDRDGYLVTGYDAQAHQWTIRRDGKFEGKYLRKRLTVSCLSYKYGNRNAVTGPEACHLHVGRFMIPRISPDDNPNFDIVESPDGHMLAITEGEGANREWQQFQIVRYEALPDR